MNLFYLSDVKFGGWPTFTSHLVRGLGVIDRAAHIFKVSNRSEGQHRPFGRQLSYRNLSIGDACELAAGGLVVVSAPKQLARAEALLDAGAGLVIHDPTELKGACARLVTRHTARPLITVREANLKMLRDLGGDPMFIPHPYFRCPVSAEPNNRLMACSISRLDFDKHIDIICEANDLLAKEAQRIAIFGAENRLYTHHKLQKLHPGWRHNYRGPFPPDSMWGGYQIARRFRSMVDMSVIVGDGGGTQYTHLEALDAGTNLILNRGWRIPGGEINGLATYVDTGETLAKAVRVQEVPPHHLVDALLKVHDAPEVAARYVEVLA